MGFWSDANFSIVVLPLLCGIAFKTTVADDGNFLCFEDRQFLPVRTGKDFSGAKQDCELRNDGWTLARIDTKNLADEVKAHVRKNPDGHWRDDLEYWVAGEPCAEGQQYCWIGTDTVISDESVGFNTELVYNQNDRIEYLLKGEMPTLQANAATQTHAHICQRKKSLPIVLIHSLQITDSTPRSVNCTIDFCAPTWITRNEVEVANLTEPQQGVQQRVEGTASYLWFSNVDESAAGTFYCKTVHNSSTYQAVEVTVHSGRPSNATVLTQPCSSNATLKWTPSSYCVNRVNRIWLPNGQFHQITPTNRTEQMLDIDGLSSSTQYTANITCCGPTERCTGNFAPTVVTFITGGAPHAVRGLDSKFENETKCAVSWFPSSPTFNITAYKIQVEETAVISRPGSRYRQTWRNETRVSSYLFTPRSNLIYNISVSAENCAGNSDVAFIQSKCSILQASAPETVPSPQIITTETLTMPKIKISVPNEAAGLISCLLVMISDKPERSHLISDIKKRYSIDELSSMLNATDDTTEYLAFAISPDKFTNASNGNLAFTVGNESVSSCNVTDSSINVLPMNTSCGGEIICGMNKLLQKEFSYRAHVVAVVYSNNSLLLSKSEYEDFDTRKPTVAATSSIAGIVGGVVGGLACLVVLVVVVTICVKKSKSDGYDASNPTFGNGQAEDVRPAPPRRAPPTAPKEEDDV